MDPRCAWVPCRSAYRVSLKLGVYESPGLSLLPHPPFRADYILEVRFLVFSRPSAVRTTTPIRFALAQFPPQHLDKKKNAESTPYSSFVHHV